MYASVWVVTLACLLAVRVAQTESLSVAPFLLVMTAGLAFSALVSRRPLGEGARIAFGFLDGMIALLTLTAQTYLNEMVGLNTDGALEIYLSRSFLWYLTLRSWVLVTIGSVAFQCVPGLAVFGLVATYVLATELIWLFVLFVLSMLFTLAVAHLVESTPTSTSSPAPPVRPMELRSALRIAMGAGGVASLFGFAVAGLLAITLGQLISGMVVGLPLRHLANSPASNTGTEIQVGAGPTALSQIEVMRVTATGQAVPRYLRQDVYEVYNGKGWNRLRLFVEDVYPNAEGIFVFNNRFSSVPEEYQTTLRIRLQLGWHRALYTPGVPLSVSAPVRQILLTIPHRTLTTPTPLGAGASYEVTAYIPPDNPDLLRQRTATLPRFNSFPTPASTERVRQLVQDLVRGAPTDYDKVFRLKRYIETNTAYNLQVSAYPSDEDPVEYFLFEAKEGYCVEFATALAVMCQYAGLPARVVSGYLLREPDPETGVYIVREADRHLWTEVYFDGIGWVAFDATEGAPVIDGGEGALAGGVDEARRHQNWRRWLIDGAIALGIAYLLYLIGSSWRVRTSPQLAKKKHAETYHRLVFSLQLAGVSAPAPYETPASFLQRAQSRLKGSVLENALKNLEAVLPSYLFGSVEQANQLEPTVHKQVRELERALKQEIPLSQRTVKTVQLYWRKLNGDIA